MWQLAGLLWYGKVIRRRAALGVDKVDFRGEVKPDAKLVVYHIHVVNSLA